jgi:membrane associated rhomboid family serine protease
MNQYTRVRFGFEGSGMPEMVKNLLIANGAVFAIQLLMGNSDPMIGLFGLVPNDLWTHYRFWQWFTYMFLHGSLWHIGMNMYVLWMFGSDIERMWGSRAFLRYYLISGIGAGILYSLVNFHSVIPTIGASGAVYALLVAFAVLFPNRQIMMIFPPVVMKARTMVMIFLGIELLMGIGGSRDGIAHIAHLGGALVGYLYMRRSLKFPVGGLRSRLSQWNQKRKQKELWKHQAELNRLRRVVDDILDRANKVGIENLTREEQDLLKKASKILNKNKD